MRWPGIFRRRPKPFAAAPADDGLWEGLLASGPVLRRLPPAEAAVRRGLCGEFLAAKDREGVRGRVLEPAMALRVAAWACLPLLRLGIDWYDDWNNLFISPAGFTDTRQRWEAGGAVTEWEDDLAGEVLELGPVVLSWDDVLEAGSGSGYNVVIHEMAHKLDARDGELDGAPPLPRGMREAWQTTFRGAWEEFSRQVDQWERRGRLGAARGAARPGRGHVRLSLDDYAADSPEEFFAVCCEHFFDRPLGLKSAWPAVYDCLAGFFRLDPASWI